MEQLTLNDLQESAIIFVGGATAVILVISNYISAAYYKRKFKEQKIVKEYVDSLDDFRKRIYLSKYPDKIEILKKDYKKRLDDLFGFY